MLLSIIVVSYNTSQLTQQTLISADQDVKGSKLLKGETEFIIIDNNSSDSSVKDLKQLKLSSPVTVIENKQNTGFAAANNQGIAKAKGNYFLLLNSDTVVQPGALEALVKTFEKNPEDLATAPLSSFDSPRDNIGIVAAMLLNKDRSVQAQGGDLPTLLSLQSQLFFLDDLPLIGKFLPSTQHTGRNTRYTLQEKHLIPMGWVGGTAMMISRRLVEEIGDLDSNIFMYGEDIEYCLRARKHLFDIVISPRAQIVHLGSQSGSSRKAIEGELKGYQYIWAKHKPHWQIPLLGLMLRMACLVRFIIFSTIGQDKEKAQLYRELLHTL